MKESIGLVVAILLMDLALGRQMHDSEPGVVDANVTIDWRSEAVYHNPWTQNNVALVYAHQLEDGVGAQTMRIMEIYAVATSLNIGYVHRPIRCVGHVDGRVHFRDSNCSTLKEADRRLLEKLRRLITLPSTFSEQEVSSWDQKHVPKLGWFTLTDLVTAAVKNQRPTLIVTEFATSITHRFPDMYLSVPEFRPSEKPSGRLLCPRHDSTARPVLGRPWLLHALRIAVHFRRGDIAENKRWSDRMLPPEYYINIVRKVMQVLDEVGCVFTVEVYTETPKTPEGKAELQLLHERVPSTVMLVSADLAWSWQMMATADILVMSNSAFSLSAALLNPNAFNIFFPNAKPNQFRIQMGHWFTPVDRNGTLPQTAVEELKRRLSNGPSAAGSGAESEVDSTAAAGVPSVT